MPIVTKEQGFGNLLMLLHYNSNLEQFEFESYSDGDENYEQKIQNFESSTEPTSSVLISFLETESNINEVYYTTNLTSFEADYGSTYGFDIDSSNYSTLIEEILFSSLSEYELPETNKVLSYDFKFLKSKGNYKFINLESFGAKGDITSPVTGRSSSEPRNGEGEATTDRRGPPARPPGRPSSEGGTYWCLLELHQKIIKKDNKHLLD